MVDYFKTKFPNDYVYMQANWYSGYPTGDYDYGLENLVHWFVDNDISPSWPDSDSTMYDKHLSDDPDYTKFNNPADTWKFCKDQRASGSNHYCIAQYQWPDITSGYPPEGTAYLTPESELQHIREHIDPYLLIIVQREPFFSDSDGTLDTWYPGQSNVKSWIEVKDAADDEGYDPQWSTEPSATMPVVTVSVTDDTATESGTTTGTIVLSCDDCSGESVAFNWGGSAKLGTDFTSSQSSPVTMSGSDVTVTITPIDDSDFEFTETASLTIDEDISQYERGSPYSGTVNIISDDAAPGYTATQGILKDQNGAVIILPSGAALRN